MEITNNKLHVVMFPWFAYGHINPFVQLSKKLSAHGIQISFFSIPGNISRIKSSLNITDTNNLIQIIPLTVPPVEGLPPNFDSSSDVTLDTAELLKEALDQMQPQVKLLLSQLQPQIVLFDFAHYWLPPIATEFNIKAVHFSIFAAVSYAYLTVSRRVSEPYAMPNIEDLKKPPPGFPQTSITSIQTFQARDLMYIFKSFNGGPPVFKRVMGVLNYCDALIFRSCKEMEGPYIDYLKAELGKSLLLAGPVVPLPPIGALEPKWANWLDQFAENSVIFCNFGSESYLSNDQIEELTLGLELTNLPFFLVLKFETKASDAHAKLEAALPKGFKERVKDRGVVHTGWVQQQHILAHKNVGCFLTHSGFSSLIEGVVNDCQLAFVAQKGDQCLNSKLFSGDLKVGVEVNRRDGDGFFGKEDIVEAVKTVMVDTDKEPAVSIRANHKKQREFLLNKEIEDQYIANLVKDLKDMVSSQA